MPMHNSYNHYVMILYKEDFDPVRHRWCPADVARVTGGLLPLHVMVPPGRGRDAPRGAYTDGVPAITCTAVGCRDGLSDGSRASVAADAAGGDSADPGAGGRVGGRPVRSHYQPPPSHATGPGGGYACPPYLPDLRRSACPDA